jgi:hypothetical protein
MRKYVLRSLVRAILDQPRVPKRYQAAMNAEILKRITEGAPRRKNQKMSPEGRFWRRILQRDSCWLWRGRSMNLSTETGVMHPRRFAIERFAGVTLAPGKIPSPVCGNDECVNPEHQSVRRKQQSRLTEDQVAAIKADPRPYPQIAGTFGICRSYVSQIRNGNRTPHRVESDEGFKLIDPRIGPNRAE